MLVFYDSSVIQSEDHFAISSKTGASERPISVKEYSMRTGVSAKPPVLQYLLPPALLISQIKLFHLNLSELPQFR